jgi:hypothetical protein
MDILHDDDEEYADVEEDEGSDAEFCDLPSPQRHRRSQRGRNSERTEQLRAVARERARQARALETEEERAQRLASNLASVRARRQRIRRADEEEVRLLEEEAIRRGTAAENRSSSGVAGEHDEELNAGRLLFYQLTLPAAGNLSCRRCKANLHGPQKYPIRLPRSRSMLQFAIFDRPSPGSRSCLVAQRAEFG